MSESLTSPKHVLKFGAQSTKRGLDECMTWLREELCRFISITAAHTRADFPGETQLIFKIFLEGRASVEQLERLKVILSRLPISLRVNVES